MINNNFTVSNYNNNFFIWRAAKLTNILNKFASIVNIPSFTFKHLSLSIQSKVFIVVSLTAIISLTALFVKIFKIKQLKLDPTTSLKFNGTGENGLTEKEIKKNDGIILIPNSSQVNSVYTGAYFKNKGGRNTLYFVTESEDQILTNDFFSKNMKIIIENLVRKNLTPTFYVTPNLQTNDSFKEWKNTQKSK